MAAAQAVEPFLNAFLPMATDVLAAPPPSRRLDPLRDRLEAIRRRRSLGRRLTAWSAVAVAALAAVLVALVLDWLFSLPRAGRLWLWAGIVAAVVWAFRRYALPLLRVQETDIDVALCMEKAHGIDSDFVAALQFERPEAGAWGSSTLRSAVVDYVSEFGRQWTSAAPLWNRVLAERMAWAAGLAAVLTAFAIAFPSTFGAFCSRMALASVHYPTWTRIERLVIAGREIDPRVGGAIKAPAGQPLRIEVACGGRRAAEGRAEFTPEAGGLAAKVPLAAAETAEPASGQPPLAGELPNLSESARVVVHAGDAFSEPVTITAVPAPIVEAALRIEPPDYARGMPQPAAAGRQAAVLEGSSVAVEVVCLNKALDRVEAVIDGTAHPLVRRPAEDGGRDTFVLSGSGSPLAVVKTPVQYEIRAVDTDGLSPDRAPSGSIRIRPDTVPQVTAEAVTRAVLPTARPAVRFTVRDDFGVAALKANVEVVRAGDKAARPGAEPAPVPGPPALELLRPADRPWMGDALPKEGRFLVPLADYDLKKGDFVRVVLEAVDFRGPTPGQSATSPAVDLTVTDENGVLEALSASESQAAQELQTIIEEQLRVGEKP